MKDAQKSSSHKNPASDPHGKNAAGFEARTNYPVQRTADGAVENLKSTASKVLNHNFSGVNVELNSKAPGKIGAVATAQGKNVKIAPSHSDLTQKKNIEVAGHEIRHTQQQDLNMVKANASIGGVPVNTEKRHESDADSAGKRIANAIK